jgi:hypothetical protein
MKQKFNFIIVLLAVWVISSSATAEEFTKKFNQSWPASSVETLSISNKFGEVKVNSEGGSSITIDVVVTAEGSERKAKEILDDITVTFGKDGNTATAVTKIEEGFRSNGNFSIDYTVNIPAEKNLVIRNKYGNTVVNKVSGNGDFDIAYGNLKANSLTGTSVKLDLSYGKADIQTISDADIILSYSKLFLGSGNSLKLDSKYSGFNNEKLESLMVTSKYDSFNMGVINSLEGNSKYTNYKIGRLNKKLKLDTGYGTVRVEQIPAGFDLLEVHSGYGQISLGIDDNAGYEMDADCSYCEISYPKDKFKGNRISENTSQSVNGKIASGTPGKVVVVSKYGNIKLVK